jgi:hypothetical protein
MASQNNFAQSAQQPASRLCVPPQTGVRISAHDAPITKDRGFVPQNQNPDCQGGGQKLSADRYTLIAPFGFVSQNRTPTVTEKS